MSRAGADSGLVKGETIRKSKASARGTRGYRFTKADKLLQRTEFLRLAGVGKKIQNPYFIAYFDAGKSNHIRLGITVTRKVGHAATRNRIKRHIREYFRQHRQTLKDDWDISIIVKKQTGPISNSSIILFLEDLFKRIAGCRHD